jgi:hypothetical protein
VPAIFIVKTMPAIASTLIHALRIEGVEPREQ